MSQSGHHSVTYPLNPEASPLFRMIVFFKYGITFRELIRQIDIEANPIAHRRHSAVHRDYWAFRTGKKLSNLKLKFSFDHFEIITHGLDFGVRQLNEYELADCLDEICPCCQKHSPTYIKKLRSRIEQVCQRLARKK